MGQEGGSIQRQCEALAYVNHLLLATKEDAMGKKQV